MVLLTNRVEYNQLYIHHVECKLCFTTVHEGMDKLHFKLLRENLCLWVWGNIKLKLPVDKFGGPEMVREI